MGANRLTVVLLVALIFSSCTRREMDPLLSSIMALPSTQQSLPLSTLTAFDWDDVVLCNPGVTQAELDTILPGVQKKAIDLGRVLAFRKGGKIVYKIVYDFNPEEPSPVEFVIDTNHFLVIRRDEAVFSVVRHDNYVELRRQ